MAAANKRKKASRKATRRRKALRSRPAARYDAARPTRLRKFVTDAAAASVQVERDAVAIRNQARDLERNNDLARGALNVLVRNVVGPKGIGIEPAPKGKDGKKSDALAKQLSMLLREWSYRPEVTRRHGWAQAQKILARAWFRDGEVFAQVLKGNVPKLTHGTRIPFSLELLEADFVPFDWNQGDDVRNGIQVNTWGQATKYFVYRRHPNDRFGAGDITNLKQINSASMVHAAMVDRLHQLRGMSVFASVITRLEDIKDYEESERIAAKVAASMTAYIKKGNADSYNDKGGGTDATTGRAELRLQPGMIFTDLLPGEEIGLVDTNRPNTNLLEYRNGQLRAAAAGLDVSFSSLSRNYDGTYSAQRQELVEQWAAYASLSEDFIQQMLRPIWRGFVDSVIASGLAKLPRDIDINTIYDAEFVCPAMPWIDPLKEANANLLRARMGEMSMTQIIRQRGGDPQETFEQIEAERKDWEKRGIVLLADAGATPVDPTLAGQDDVGSPTGKKGRTRTRVRAQRREKA